MTLILCQICRRTFSYGEVVCHPEHARNIEEGRVTRDKYGRVVDYAEARQQMRAAKPR